MRAPRTWYLRHPRRSAAFWSALVFLVAAPILSVGGLSHAAPTPSAGVGSAGSAHSGLRSWPIPLLPVHVRPIGVDVPAVVDPTGYYSSEPAPMGIGDFGVGSGGKPYTYSTSAFLGNFSWQNLSLDDGGVTEFTDQLNVVLQFEQGGVTYAYWIQDVAFMDSSTGELTFEDNIWNFSNPDMCLSSSAVSGNGTVNPYSGCVGYYAVGATSQPGADEFMPSPGDFSLLVRSYLTGGGVPEVAFEYWDGVTPYEVTYDNVVWPWATAISADNDFYVDGNATAPTGNFYDAELTLGGPGGGQATIAQSVTDASSRLLYWNGHNFEATRAVWNFGSDTAEAVSNVQSVFGHDSGGTPLTTQLNGTARNATPDLAYDQARVGVLAISAPGFSSGTASVAGTVWSFQTDQAELTLVPGSYHVWVNSSSQHNDLGSCAVSGGETTSVSLPGSCGPAVSTPTGTPPGADIGQAVTFQTTLTAQGSGGDTFSWGPLSPGLACASSTGDSISCRPTTSGTYAVAVTVTDSDGRSSTSGTLEYTVDSDPTVTSPVATPPTAPPGTEISFTASAAGGSGGYRFAWAGLPTPCTGTLTAAPVCHPASSGVYSVSVTVTDSNGYEVTSAPLNYTVTPGSLVAGLAASPPGPIDLGQSVVFSSNASGGTGPYTYLWQNLPAGCSSVNASSLTCTPTAGRTSSVTVLVSDAVGDRVTAGPIEFTVNPELEVSSVSASPESIDLGQNVTFTALGVSGGDGVYDYEWSGLPTGCGAMALASVTCEPNETGAFSAKVTVSDTDGSVADGTVPLTVFSDPSVVGISVSRASVDVGGTVTYTAEGVSGGTGNYSYEWTGLPIGCASETASTLSCTPAGAGNFSVALTVTDSNNLTATSPTVLFTVFSPPSTTLTVTPGSVLQSGRVTFEVSGSGGSGNLTYVWSGLPSGCTAPTGAKLTCSPSATGTYEVTVTAIDQDGGRATSTANLTVDPAFLGLPALEGYAAAGLAGAAAAALGIVGLARRRRKRDDQTVA